jgi:shikimate kinase
MLHRLPAGGIILVMNIVLVGFRGAGKTVIGKLLAEKLSWEFIDVDDYIEKTTMMTIKEIFSSKGEPFFRLIESDAISEVSKLDGKIIATGGGAVLKYKNVHNLKHNGIIIFLEVCPETAYNRIKNDERERPSLSKDDLFTEIKREISVRNPYYLGVADILIHTDNKLLEEIVENITVTLKENGMI